MSITPNIQRRIVLLGLCLALAAGAWAQPPQDAIPIQVQGSAVDSAQVDLLLFDGELYLEEQDYAKAIGRFRSALSLDSEHFEARLLYARALTLVLLTNQASDPGELGREAVRQLRWVLDHEPGHPEASEAMRLLAAKFGGSEAPALRTERARIAWTAGTRAMGEERFDDAVDEFRTVVRAEPRAPGVHRALADALREAGRFDEARVTYLKSIEINDQDYRARTGLGMLFEAEDRPGEALEHFRAAFQLNPRYPAAADGLLRLMGDQDLDSLDAEDLSLYGRALLAAGRLEAAADVLARARTYDDLYITRRALGITLYLLDDLDQAIEPLTSSYDENPRDSELAYYLGALHIKQGRRVEGRQLLVQVLESDPANGNALELMGLSLADEPGREEEALTLLQRAKEAGSEVRNYACVAGMLEMRRGNDADARRLFRSCLEVAPDFAPARLGLGIMADRNGNKNEAILHLEQYSQLVPDNPGVLIRLGVAYLRVGKEDEGYQTLARIPEMDSAFAPADGSDPTEEHLLEMASFFLATVRSYDDAIWIGEKLLTFDTKNSIYNNNLAMVYADADRDASRGHELAVVANQLERDNPGHMDTLAWTLIRLQRYEEAEALLNRAIQLAGDAGRRDLSEVYYHLGFLYRMTERHEEADRWLNKALENPPTPFLRTEIELLLEGSGSASN